MKKLLLALLFLIIIGAVAFGVRTLGARDETDKVESKDAAALVQDEDGKDAGDIEPGDRPKPGTYTYTGKGKESVTALGGSEHVFPSEFPVVIELDADDDCAWTSNVVYVKQHIEERSYCTKGGVVIDHGFTRKIEFFNQLSETTFTCPDSAERLRTDSQEGDTWKWTCEQGTKTKSEYTATALGQETLTIGSEPVETWHTKVVSKQTGDTVGGDTSEFWLDKTGLIVKFTADLDVKSESVLGPTQYREQLGYTLTSLVPEAS